MLDKFLKCFPVSAFLSGKWERCKGGLYGNEEYETCRAENSPWMPIQTRGEFGIGNKGGAANKSPQTMTLLAATPLRRQISESVQTTSPSNVHGIALRVCADHWHVPLQCPQHSSPGADRAGWAPSRTARRAPGPSAGLAKCQRVYLGVRPRG